MWPTTNDRLDGEGHFSNTMLGPLARPGRGPWRGLHKGGWQDLGPHVGCCTPTSAPSCLLPPLRAEAAGGPECRSPSPRLCPGKSDDTSGPLPTSCCSGRIWVAHEDGEQAGVLESPGQVQVLAHSATGCVTLARTFSPSEPRS